MYLIIDGENFGFALTNDNNLKSVEISQEDYNTFFENQSNGKQYKLKNELPEENCGLFDYLEEYTIDSSKEPAVPLENRVKALESVINSIILE